MEGFWVPLGAEGYPAGYVWRLFPSTPVGGSHARTEAHDTADVERWSKRVSRVPAEARVPLERMLTLEPCYFPAELYTDRCAPGCAASHACALALRVGAPRAGRSGRGRGRGVGVGGGLSWHGGDGLSRLDRLAAQEQRAAARGEGAGPGEGEPGAQGRTAKRRRTDDDGDDHHREPEDAADEDAHGDAEEEEEEEDSFGAGGGDVDDDDGDDGGGGGGDNEGATY